MNISPNLPRLEISVTALVPKGLLGTVFKYLDGCMHSAAIGIAVRDPENPGRCNMRIMPGSQASAEIFTAQLGLLERSSLITTETARAINGLRETLGSISHSKGHSFSRAAEVALDRTPMQQGDLFCILDLSGINDAVPKCLARFPASIGITSPVCVGVYAGQFWPESWVLGSLSKAGPAECLRRLDEMTDRGKLSAETGRLFGEWIKEASEQVGRLSALPVSRTER